MHRIPPLITLFTMFILAAGCSGNKHSTASPAGTGAQKSLKTKYAGIMGVSEEDITNVALYKFIDGWYGAPYKYGGKTKDGIDCSGFASVLYTEIYQKKISGSASSICQSSDPVSESKLKEGDLVFFKIDNGKVSHVGVYLQNRHFVHASTHSGVVINSLDEAYYKKYYFRGGRIK